MSQKLYDELIDWYRLIDPPEDHADEGAAYRAALDRAVAGRFETLLELGAGAGHNALHMKAGLRCTLTDISERMLTLSRALNPECEHLVGDMRTLRLQRTFDAVLVHDAVCYMLTEDELTAAAHTAFLHTRPGGAAVFAPDCLADTFHEETDVQEYDEPGGARGVRYLQWVRDPDPTDTTYAVDYGFLLRDGARVHMVHDQHVEGLFARATWMRVLTGVGFQVQTFARPIEAGTSDQVFICRRPS